jgi:hypothetical protein
MSNQSDYGTKELHRRHLVRPEFIGGGHSIRVRVIDQKVLDNLLLSKKIQLDHYQTLDSMMIEHYNSTIGLRAQTFEPRVKGTSSDYTDKYAVARSKVRKVLEEVRENLGREVYKILRSILEDVPLTKVQMMWVEANGNMKRLINIVGKYYG